MVSPARGLRGDGLVIDAIPAGDGQVTAASTRRLRARSLPDAVEAVAASVRLLDALAMEDCARRRDGLAMASATRSLLVAGRAGWPPFMARYERLELLGRGINGEVYKAWDTKDKEVVAVKRLSGSGDAHLIMSGVCEIARETMSLAACRGIPTVVQLRATLAERHRDGDAFIVMEYVGRLNLRRCMELRRRHRRPFSEAEVRRIMKQLLQGVKDVHRLGILHRDIMPENVLLDDGTEDRTRKPAMGAVAAEGNYYGAGRGKEPKIIYKISGFGMSLPKAREQGQQMPEVIILTPYSAPELLLRTTEYDERVDTWGLGCIMAELLAGTATPVFDGDSPIQIMDKLFDTVGAKGIKEWSGYKRLAKDPAPRLKGCSNVSRLREHFPSRGGTGKPALSPNGFKVLTGLLESNPEKRLTAAEALQMPWFKGSRLGFGACLTSCIGGVLSEILD